MKSALTGRCTAAAILEMYARFRSRVVTASSPESGNPCENAKPALVVARAGNPRCCRYRADPTSQGLGITKHPRSWSARKALRRAASAAESCERAVRPGTTVDGVVTLIVMLLVRRLN